MAALAGLPPGPQLCAALAGIDVSKVSGYEMVLVLQARARQGNYERGMFLAAVAETIRRTDPDHGVLAEPDQDDRRKWNVAELRAALVLTRTAATELATLAHDLARRLPAVLDAMVSGRLDQPRARIFSTWTELLADRHVQQIVKHVLPRAHRMTTGELIEAIQKAAIELDPRWARRRYENALRKRQVKGVLRPDGTADLTGSYLPADQVAAACDRIDALAHRLKKAGYPSLLNWIRADIYLGKLDGRYEGLSDDELFEHLMANPVPKPAPDPEPPTPDDQPTPEEDAEYLDYLIKHGIFPDPDDLLPGNYTDQDHPDNEGQGDGPGGPNHEPGERPDDRPDDPPGLGVATPQRPDDNTSGGAAQPMHPSTSDTVSEDASASAGPAHTTNLPPEASTAETPKPGKPSTVESPRLAEPPTAADPPQCPSGPDGPPGSTNLKCAPDADGRPGTDRPGAGMPSASDPVDPPSPGDVTDGPGGAKPRQTGGSSQPAAAGRVRGRGLRLLVGLATIAGLDRRPGQLLGFGFVHAELARRMSAAAAARWFYALVQPDGAPIQVGLIRHRPTRPWAEGHIPDYRHLEVWLHLTPDELTQLTQNPPPGWEKVITSLAKRIAAGQRQRRSVATTDPTSRLPGKALRRWLHLRDRRCVFPGCRIAPHRTDADHTIDYARGGLTTHTNIGSLCRPDHQLRHKHGWRIHQPQPGHFTWTSPLGHRYHRTPPPGPADTLAPMARPVRHCEDPHTVWVNGDLAYQGTETCKIIPPPEPPPPPPEPLGDPPF